MIQVRFRRKDEELSMEQLRSRIADGTLRREAKVRSTEIFGDESWHSIESTTQWAQLAPIWHVPPPGPSLSKTGLSIAVILFGGIAGLGRILQRTGTSDSWGSAVLPGLVNAIIWFDVVYIMWKSIRGSFTSTSPGDAVVGFFIPGYNVYWLFGAHIGFARNYNRVAAVLQDRFGKAPPQLQVWPFVLFGIAFLTWAVASSISNVAGGVVEFVQLGVRVLVLSKVCDAVNALHALRRDSVDIAQA